MRGSRSRFWVVLERKYYVSISEGKLSFYGVMVLVLLFVFLKKESILCMSDEYVVFFLISKSFIMVLIKCLLIEN